MLYRCFGLVVECEFSLPELQPAGDGLPVDVTIRRELLTPPGADVTRLLHGLWRVHDRCGVDIEGVARFEARAGREIAVDVHAGADEDGVRVYLLGTLMGAILMQRGNLVLHGNAFRIGDECVVVVGHSGAGKSTLAAEMQRRGFEVLSDDVVPIDADGRALPGYPRIKLWADALDRLGVPSAGLTRVHADHQKFEVPLSRHVSEPLPVRAVYALDLHDGALELTATAGIAAFNLLNEHTYRRELVHGRDAASQHLRQCSDLVARAVVVHVLRPRDIAVEQTADALLGHLGPNPAGTPPLPHERLGHGRRETA